MNTQGLSVSISGGAPPSASLPELCIFPNQKLYFNVGICRKIRKRCEAFKSGDTEKYKRGWYKLGKSIRATKWAYSQKLESLYLKNNTHGMWQGIQSVTNYRKNTTGMETQDTTFPESLSTFYARFDRLNTDNS